MVSGSDSGHASGIATTSAKPPASNASLGEEPDEESQRRKRKKAARACNHCQTAHLTCDDNRPCGRCVKRGLADTCQDGARKKAKYLRDIEDALVNAGKAVPTHFLHSPPAGQASASKEAGPVKHSNDKEPSSQSDTSPLLPTQELHNASFTSQNIPTESPSHFSNLALPPHQAANSTTSGFHQSPISEAIPLNGTNDHNGSINLNSASIPSNAYSNNDDNNLLNFDSTNTLQPFNFFNDLNIGSTGEFSMNSNSANLEYAVLSSMLQNSGYGNTSPMGFTENLSLNNAGPQSHNTMYQGIFTGSGDYGQMSFGFPPAAFENGASNSASGSGGASNNHGSLNHPSHSPSDITSYLPGSGSQHPPNSLPSLQAPTNAFGALPIDHNWPTIASKLPNGNDSSSQQQHQGQQQQQQQQQQSHLGSQPSPSFAQTVLASNPPKSKPIVSSTGVMKVEDVYKHINKPYNYLEAYHALIRYLQANFENKSNVLRIIRSLSIYRPSIIALHMPLTQEDEVFVERSFQRTLIELEKLISFSGTPTLVWRRTGEIVLVGTEFTLLSEWRREDLLCRDRTVATEQSNDSAVKEKKASKSKKRYIFELFDQESLVEYYETFAQHAFESSSATIMFTCNIVTPKGRKVPCTFGYNLKRDIFGLPQMVIGQFLPILTSPDEPAN